jgi:hypothetical protein
MPGSPAITHLTTLMPFAEMWPAQCLLRIPHELDTVNVL